MIELIFIAIIFVLIIYIIRLKEKLDWKEHVEWDLRVFIDLIYIILNNEDHSVVLKMIKEWKIKQGDGESVRTLIVKHGGNNEV